MTATAPARKAPTYRIDREVEVRPGVVRTEFTRKHGDYSADGYAFPAAPPSRDVLEDRWHAAMSKPNGESTKTSLRLERVLWRLADEVSGWSSDDEQEHYVVADGKILPVSDTLDIRGLEDVIRDWIIDRAARVAR